MKIRAICAGPVDTNAYLIVNETDGTAVAVDTPMGSAAWFEEEAKRHDVSITQIWLTHSHWDHTADCEQLRLSTGARVFMHAADEYRLIDPNAHLVFDMPYTFTASRLDETIVHGQHLVSGSDLWEVRHVPGHTEGSVCFVHHKGGVIIAGDTLFKGSVGRTDLPGGSHEQLITSIQRELMTLDDTMVVLPGHMDFTTIGEERVTNPFLNHNLGGME